ncbi:hypothetical protein G7Y89_g7796 [Cudoniella acicularis]|uniref:Uncharacterized protein n=1 Tax=Cudoniella acicularis TaxID=354080 RepID=A0A8H4RHT9_9HELO|nr:hypothetical protein G7Y89_g7796 [Cudoniella acicularis]
MVSSKFPVALITAGSAGLGAATARLFVSHGFRVVINYASNSTRAEELVQELQSLSSIEVVEGKKNIAAIRGDISKRADIIDLVQSTVLDMGRLDVVFSNAGWTKICDFMDLDDNVNEDDWDKCWNMNVKSHLWLMHAVRPYLDDSEGAYSVTKAAQIHLIKSLAMIASPKIRVNSVSPGILLTEWGMKFPQERLEAAREKTQLKRFVTVEDVATQVFCFASSRTVTGANAIIDAGWSL